MNWSRTAIIVLSIAAAILILWWLQSTLLRTLFAPTEPGGLPGVSTSTLPAKRSLVPADTEQTSRQQPSALQPQPAADIEVITSDLTIPWAIDWLPSGSLLVTERPGRLLLINEKRTAIPIQGVEHIGEGGLLGLAVHPRFATNQFIYLYLTTQTSTGLINRVERYSLQGTQLTDRRPIIDNIPGARFHDGGRIAFGPDGLLYITTGDAGEPANAPNPTSLAGKILRLRDDGTIPADNPFNSPVYSLGHRNPQGITWDPQGRLWSTEHGRSGLRSGLDELNRITAAANYGWPDSQGDTVQPNTIAPILHSGPTVTWAPASIAYLNNNLFFTGLRGEALYQVPLNPDGTTIPLIAHFHREFGRLREVKVGPDGFLYLTTSNQDGRGSPKANDDKIIRLNPNLFN